MKEESPIVIQQVSAGENGAGYVIIRDSKGKAIGYCLSIAQARETPNGTDWPVAGTTTEYVEYWWFSKPALQAIKGGTLTEYTLESSDLIPANPGTTPLLNSDPLTAIPAQFGAVAYVEWTCNQNPTFNNGSTPTSGGSHFKLFQNDDEDVCLGWHYTGSGSSLALAHQWWASTVTSTLSFWFGSSSGKPSGSTQVNGDFTYVSQYPPTAMSYKKKSMDLDPASVPLG